jgi:hypothetical protein
MEIILPREVRKPTIKDPRTLIILSPHKTGKTSAAMMLPNSCLIDLENNSEYFEGMSINIKELATKNNKGMGNIYYAVAERIKKENLANNGVPIYDYIIIDTLTQLEKIARDKALVDWRSSVIGKAKIAKGEDIKDVLKDIGQGGGYDFLYSAFIEMFSLYHGLAGKCVIYLAHRKFDKKTRGTEEIEITDIDLAGKLRGLIPSMVDGIGHLYRSSKKPHTNVMSFCKADRDNVFGSRMPHLREKKFIFSVYDPKKEEIVECNWDQIFLSLANKNTSKMQEVDDEEFTTFKDTSADSEYPT